MKDIAPILRSLGLLDSEISTYLTALEHGPGTVLDLTKQTKLSRQATYVAIESLTKRGLMSSYVSGKKRFYAAEHPERLLGYARRRETKLKDYIHELERSIPELSLQMGGERPIVKVFEGKEGIRAMLDDLTTSRPKNIDEIADLEALRRVLTQEDLQPYRDTLKKLSTGGYMLTAGDPLTRVSEASRRYILPKEFWGFKSDIFVINEKIYLITFEGKMYSVIIESKPLAQAMHVLFQYALKTAQQLPQK